MTAREEWREAWRWARAWRLADSPSNPRMIVPAMGCVASRQAARVMDVLMAIRLTAMRQRWPPERHRRYCREVLA